MKKQYKWIKDPAKKDNKNHSIFYQEYRKVWEDVNGKIPKGLVIHHIDGNIYNNNLNNLKLMTKQEHDLLHNYGHKTTNI